jgi:archaellum component FlaC
MARRGHHEERKMNVMIRFPLVAAMCFCLAMGAFAHAQDKDQSSAEAVKQHAQETYDAAKKYTLEQKEAYQKKMEAEIADLSHRIGELKDKAQTLKGEALEALEARLADLKEKQKVAEEKVNALRSASAQAWDHVRTGADKAFQDLKKAYEALGHVVK